MKILSDKEMFQNNLSELINEPELGLVKLENPSWQEFLANKTLEDLKNILENADLFDSEGPGVDETMFSVDHGVDFSTAEKLNKLLEGWDLSDDDMKSSLKNIITDHNSYGVSYV